MSSISETIKELIRQQLLTLHTCLICKVLHVYADGTAKIHPLTMVQTTTGEVRQHQALDGVPILDHARSTVKVGSICVAVFAERDIAKALSGTYALPSLARHHSMSDGLIVGTIGKDAGGTIPGVPLPAETDTAKTIIVDSVDGKEVHVDVKLNPAADNLIRSTENGLYAPGYTKTDIDSMKSDINDLLSRAIASEEKVVEISDRVTDLSKSTEAELAKKQDTLTFDDTPTRNSTNPVTSSGIYTAIARSRANITAVSVDISITADMWQDGAVTITSSEVHADSVVTVGLQMSMATAELVQVVGNALIVAKSQADGVIVLECLGTIPTITIPMTLTILTDTSYAVIQTIEFTVLPSDWVDGVATLTDANFFADSIVDIGLQVGAATADIAKAAANATIAAKSQTDGAITLVCLGTVPALDLPLAVTVINIGG